MTDDGAKTLFRTVSGMSTHRLAMLATMSAVGLVISLGTLVHAGAASDPADDVAPVVTIDGGSAQHRRTVVDAVDRFAESGLTLPDLEIHIHDDKTACQGKQGLFHRGGDVGVIDLCFPASSLRCTNSAMPGSTST